MFEPPLIVAVTGRSLSFSSSALRFVATSLAWSPLAMAIDAR